MSENKNLLFPGFAVASVTQEGAVSANKNILALAGKTNNITGSTNEDNTPATYFRVN